MSISSRIPMVNDQKTFEDIMAYLNQMQQRRQQQGQFQQQLEMNKPLRAAQAAQAQGAAQKSQMIANLINQALGGSVQSDNGYTPTGTENKKLDQMNSGNSSVIGAGQSGQSSQSTGMSSQEKAKNLLYSLGILKESPQEQEERDARTAYRSEFAKSDAKAEQGWNDKITASHEIMPVLENIQGSLANPVLQEMYKNPEYLGYDLAYLKRMGNPEQVKLLTSIGANAKSLFSSMGQEFKGAFREFEYKIFQNATPDEIKDTLPQMIAKTNTMMQLRQLVTKRLTLADNILRSSAGKISPANALEIADRQIGGKQITKQIEDQFNKAMKEEKDNIVKNFKMPSFENKNQFKSWYDNQPKLIKDLVRKNLGEK